MRGSTTAINTKNTAKRPVFLDIMVVFSIFLVIGAFAYMMLNPGKRQSDIRNAERNTEILSIMQAFSAYVKANGNIPSIIPLNKECASFGNEICSVDASDCKNYVDLTEVLKESELKAPPTDPSRAGGNGTGYYVSHNGEGSILLCAPSAERNVQITVKRFMY